MSNTTSIKCYPHYHMTAQQYGFWDVCRTLSYKNDILFFNGRNMAARFQGMSKSTAYLLADALVENGWFKLLKDSTRRKDGTFSPKQYRVLSHEDWAKEHPGGCEPVLQDGLDDISPVQPADSPVQPADQPVQPAGHNLIGISDNKQSDTESDNHTPFQPAGLDVFVNRFSKKKRGMGKSAAAPNLDRRPVQPVGLDGDVLNTQSQAERIAITISNTLGLKDGTDRLAWTNGVRKLLDVGQSDSDVLACAEHAYTCLPDTMRKEGPEGFVKHFDLIKQGWKNQAQKGKSA